MRLVAVGVAESYESALSSVQSVTATILALVFNPGEKGYTILRRFFQ